MRNLKHIEKSKYENNIYYITDDYGYSYFKGTKNQCLNKKRLMQKHGVW